MTFTIPNVNAVFQLSDALIILTILLPALLAWTFGILASVNLQFYAKEVPGIIYKKSAALLVRGVLFLTVGTMYFLIMSSLSPHLTSVGGAELLAVVHFFRAIIGLGFLFVAQGAKASQARRGRAFEPSLSEGDRDRQQLSRSCIREISEETDRSASREGPGITFEGRYSRASEMGAHLGGSLCCRSEGR